MEYKCRIYCAKEKLCELRTFVKKVLDKMHVSERQKNELILAVDEVCTNVIVHSHRCDDRHYLELTIKDPTPGALVFEILDYGDGFDIARYEAPTLEEIIKTKRKGGLGLRLVKKIMDGVEYEYTPKKHTYRLFKKCELTQ
ncbi:hypothetical protein FUAX_34550 [Fulvitalea axinellae]|uniref:Histidine kinase/HSP90-like ATPase domain-containing protein n=1 Tax=Fulvitalea axinellae TaxID=1182444 RepID=A0AAU9CLF0_9BACT|nr:hypothetical protein FUAX_34550 [Fulvitalea axinellae]